MPVRHVTFDKHLVLHVLGIIADDNSVVNSDRVIAKLLVETASVRTQSTGTKGEDDPRPTKDIEATMQQLEQALKIQHAGRAHGVPNCLSPRSRSLSAAILAASLRFQALRD
jgi:hypothetical protein